MIPAIKDFLSLAGIIACLLLAVFGGVFLLVSGWTILLSPFWIAGFLKAGTWLIDRRLGA